MQNNFLEFAHRQNIKYDTNTNTNEQNDQIGGIFRDGSFGWIVAGAHIEIISLKNGNRIAEYTFGDKRYTFSESAGKDAETAERMSFVCHLPKGAKKQTMNEYCFRFANTFIAFITEVTLNVEPINTNLLAIGVQCSPTTSCIYLFAVNGSRIIHAIEIEEKLTSCCFIPSKICADSELNSFDGCIIVGTETGKVIIVNLFVESCVRALNGLEFYNNEPKLCKIVSSALPYESIEREQYATDCDGIGFGVQLEDLNGSGSVLSILCLTPLLIVAVGFEDGKMLLYDLCTLDAFHIAHPPEVDSPLEKMTFIEPADDPRACVYLWAFHSNSNSAIAVLHSLTYELKILKQNGSGFVYKNFERCTPRLTMPIFEKHSKPISCQSITKFVIAEENFLTLCLLSWTASSGTYVCLFDLNQWYKQQLPDTCDWRSSPTFLAIFPLGKQTVLDVWMNGITVTPFSSLNRPEEHFYPSSLSFDCALLTTHSSAKLHWLGLQNEALEHLNHSGPYAILEPNRCFAEMVRASLIPQFTDYSYDMNQSLKSKREFLLSIALEYNCLNLLKKCAIAWADGSHLSKKPIDGLSLSTLTDWIWNRATSIKECCNEMCVPLFDHSGNSIEPRSQKVLLNFSRQLKRLFQLMDMIVTTCHQYIPGQVLDTLRSQRNSICMATEYQEVLQWLLNMGLLPEVNSNQPHKSFTEYRDSSFDEFQAIPYPYETLKNYYTTQRRKFAELDPDLIVPKTRSCRVLYIDSFIEQECNSSVLRSEWKKGLGDGLYPPASLQTMLRTLLVPGVATERKYMLFVYLFMDLSQVLRDGQYASVIKNLIKFPAVFKMDPGLIKITQAFWNLDHGEYEMAIDEIISPLAQDQNMSIWQRELLIGALILNDVPHLALRALHAPGAPISPSLEIRTLLANDLVADAFQVQRMKRNRNLLFEFYRGCHEQRKWHYLLNLSLNDKEEECLGEYLRSIESSLGENIHFLYLLRRSKYLEAITFIDDLHQKKGSRQLDLDTPNTILSTYRLTMTPSIRQFSDLYYSKKDDINVKLNRTAKCPKPLSSHLSQRTFDVMGGVYHQSLIHTEQTGAVYWENQQKKMCGLTPSNVPFLNGLRVDPSLDNDFDDRVCYPEPFIGTHKRRLNDSIEERDEGPAAKRHRMDYSIVNSTLLTSFKDTAHQSKSVTRESDDTIEMEDDDELLQTTLNTPVVQSRKNMKKSFSLLERLGTPQSILKSRSSYREKSISSMASRRSVDSDRSIRFNLPKDTNDTNGTLAVSTPVVPDVFNFGITRRPSIHSEITPRTPSKLLLNDQSGMKADVSPVDHNTSASQSSARKRLRSISPEELTNVTKCIDVSVEQSYKPQIRELSVSSDESNDEEEITAETINYPRTWTSSEALNQMTGNESFNLRNSTIQPLDDPVERSKNSFDRFTSFKSSFLTQPPTDVPSNPVERIIPIEIEDRTNTHTSSKVSSLGLSAHSTLGDGTINERTGQDSFNVSIFNTQLQNNLLTDTLEFREPTGVDSTYNESSLFRSRNILTDTSLGLTGQMSNVSEQSTDVVGETKEMERDTDIETVQIEDSEDSSIACDVSEKMRKEFTELENANVFDDVIPVENIDKTYKSSTPFTSKVSTSLQFNVTNDSFSTQLFRSRDILSDSTLKEPSKYHHSTWDEDSIFRSRNILGDSSYGKQHSDLASSSNRSSLNPIRGTSKLEDTGNSIFGDKVKERKNASNVQRHDKPIVIDITEPMYKVSDSTSPDLNEDYSNDIYDLSSEVDAALRDEEYDVEDYETDSEDDVIDISSGSDDDGPIISKSHKPSVNLSLPPCNTLGKRAFIDAEINVSNVQINVSATTSEIAKTTLVDESKCSEISFLTASESSVKHLASAHTIDSPLQIDEKDVLVKEDVKTCLLPVTEVDPVQNDFNNATELSQVINADIHRGTNLFLSQNEAVATFVLQDNLLSSIGDEINPTDTQCIEDTHTDFVITDLNMAVVHSENVDITEATLIQNQSEVISPSEDTISTVTEAKGNVTEGVDQNQDVAPSEETLIKSDEVSMTVEQLPDGSDFVSTTFDLNAAVLQDNTSLPDSSQQPAAIEEMMDTYEQNVMDSRKDNLNEAILYNDNNLLSQSVSESHVVLEMTVETNPTTTLVDESNQQTEDVGLDIDDINEILGSAIVPDVHQIDNVQLQEIEQKPSTSAEALKQSLSERQSKMTAKRSLRAKSEDVSSPMSGMLTRKRSGSFTPNEPGTPSVQRMTRASSIHKDTPNDDTRNTRAKSASKDGSTPVRSTRAKSEIKNVESAPIKMARANSRSKLNLAVAATSEKESEKNLSANPVRRTRSQSIAEDNDDTASIASVGSVKSERSTRSKLNPPVAATSEKETAFPANLEKVVNVPRTRSKSITEDNDDTASIVSGGSVQSERSTRSNRSTRSTRAQSHTEDDNTSTISKRTRKPAKALPVISEDLTEEAVEESQAYADTRRLTRGQRKVMATVAASAKIIPPTTVSRKRQRKPSTADAEDDDDISDNTSVSSTKTRSSTRSKRSKDTLTPVRQSQRLREKEESLEKMSIASKESDADSVTSAGKSTRSRRKSTSSKK